MEYTNQNLPEEQNQGEKENPYANYSRGSSNTFEGVTNNQGENLLIPLSASCYPVAASSVAYDGFEFETENLIPSSNQSSSFDASQNIVEFFIYDTQRNLLSRNYKFEDWGIEGNTDFSPLSGSYYDPNTGETVDVAPASASLTNVISVDPPTDLFNQGFTTGKLFTLYNFINYELGSSIDDLFYIDQISSDRTELKLKSNFISNTAITNGYEELKAKQTQVDYFDEFYINLLNNKYEIAVNCLLDYEESGEAFILIKLYVPLPTKYKVGTELYVATKVGETQAYAVEFLEDIETFVDSANYIKGPNVNIELNNLVNNSTQLKSYDELTNTKSSSSLDSVLRVLDQVGVTITPDYSYNTFNEFVNFSSAKERINNFYEKVTSIQSYEADIETLLAITGSNPNVPEVSQSLASLQTNIKNIITNFTGYESYLYYNSSSFAYPKTGSAYPYTLQPTGSTEVLTWLGSDVESNQYYGGYILSASLYDENNQNWLYYTIPQFITENSENNDYVSFANMVGESFDEIWLYTKTLSERYNTINDPDKGLPLGLTADAIKGLGFETFGNNYNNQDNFIGLTGEDNGVYVPPTGSELITQYVAVNNGEIINYWDLGYSWLDYVEQLNDPGFPYAIDKVSKEIYKRLYHNMAYLTKKKGTISGLRQLINIWGIPNTILRINEFGGKNRDNTDDYDLWYKRYSYAYTPVANSYIASSSVVAPWMPLERNYIANNNRYIVPDGVGVRFKTTGFPSSSYAGEFYSQSILVKKSNGTNDTQFDWGIGLYYEEQPSGSYSGSSFSDFYEYGRLRFFISGSVADGGTVVSDDIYLPFFNKGWWTVLLQRDKHFSASEATSFNSPITYTLYAANKQYDGFDGNVIGWEGAVSISVALTASGGAGGYGIGNYGTVTYGQQSSYNSSSLAESWNNFGTNAEFDGVHVGGFISGSNVGTNALNESSKIFSGSFQELRYYSNDIAQTVFNDFVMDPESIEGNNITGSESSFDIVNFRAPLGNELENKFTASNNYGNFRLQLTSSHPAVTGSAPSVITQSFINPANNSLSSSYQFIHYSNSVSRTYSKTNVETYFLDQPAIGVRNRVTNKIQIDDNEDYGTVLSRYKSIDQNYLISESYTEDINSLEVAFSPQDEINDDIIHSFGYGVVSDAIADPRFVSSSDDYYPQLRKIAIDYFKKYTEGDVWDYLRLIKYFDNSLFKAIKSYVPARTSVSTGVVIKQHMLERNRRQPVQITNNTTVAYSPTNQDIVFQDLEITSSIEMVTITGSNAGSPPNLRGHVSASGAGFNIVPITQSWSGSNETISGSINYIDETQTEFFNGEYSGSDFIATTQSLLNNPYAESNVIDTSYQIRHTASYAYGEQFPSYSLHVIVKFFANDDLSNALTWPLKGFKTAYSNTDMSSTASIALFQASDQQNYYIASMLLPSFAEKIGDPTFYYIGDLLDPQGITETLLPWSQGPGSDPKNPYPDFQIMSTGPYFRVENMTPNTSTYPGIDFENSGLLGGLNSGIVVSPFLGNNQIVTRGWWTTDSTYAPMTDTVDPLDPKSYRYYQFTDPGNNGSRPIRMNQSHTVNSIINGNVLPDTMDGVKLFISDFANNYYDAIKSGSTGNLNLAVSEGSVTWIGTTWTGSGPDNGTWLPAVAMFNKNTRDQYTAELIDNSSTLENSPSYKFPITNFNGTAATADSFGLNGASFTSSLVPLEGVISSPDLSEIGFAFDIQNARGISGSGGLSGIGNQFRPLTDIQRQYIPFDPAIPDQTLFYDTAFNPLVNNATESVINTYTQIVEYNDGADIPSNLVPLISQSALKARIPDSFYTQKSAINPRYEGSELRAADYNIFTEESASFTYLNAMSGSISESLDSTNSNYQYGGDISFGTTPVVSKNPIYFAHFKTSYNNLQLAGTYTYEIDALIEVPQRNVQGDKTPQTPTVVKLDGSNDNLIDVSSTFEVGRKVKVAYSSPKFKKVDYSNLKVGNNLIFQGGIEMPTISATTTGVYGSGSAKFPRFLPTYSYSSPDWLQAAAVDGSSSMATFTKGAVTGHFTMDYTPLTRAGGGYLATGSGFFVLQGENLRISQSVYYEDQKAAVLYTGPGLAIINSINTAVSLSSPNYFDVLNNEYYLGVPIANQTQNITNTDPNLPQNYFYQDFTSSDGGDIGGFRREDDPLPFIIKVGDEIECTVDESLVSGSDNFISAKQKTFIVTGISALSFNEDTSLGAKYQTEFSASACDDTQCYIAKPLSEFNVKNKISVTPNPINSGFANGQVTGFILRRRVNADDRVIVYQTPPKRGVPSVTGSGDGYLIPNDFTSQQKRNVLTLINQIKFKNAFPNDLPELTD